MLNLPFPITPLDYTDDIATIKIAYYQELITLYTMLFTNEEDQIDKESTIRFTKGVVLARKVRDEAISIIKSLDENPPVVQS